MRKYLFVLGVLLFLSAAGQKKRYVSATQLFREYEKTRDTKHLEKARNRIDEVVIHAETHQKPKVWLLKGDIYCALYSEACQEHIKESNSGTAAEKRDEAYLYAPDTFLTIASSAYIIGKQYDTGNNYSDDLSRGMMQASALNAYSGVANYRLGNPSRAMDCFFRAYTLGTNETKADTIMLYNAALSALNAKLYDRGISMGNMLAAYGYQPQAAWILTENYVRSGDTAKANATIISALKAYPSDQSLQWAYQDLLLTSRNFADADVFVLTKIQPADNIRKFLAIGNFYDQLANPIGPDSSATAKPWNYEILVNRAEANYKMALELEPEQFTARYNLAVLYFNQGVYYYNQLSEHPDDSTAMYKNWGDFISLATIEFEEARKIEPNDLSTLRALKQCYGLVGNAEKYREVKDRIGELESGAER